MSRDGRIARDTMLGLMQTCRKLGISFYHYLGDRLGMVARPSRNWQALSRREPERRLVGAGLHEWHHASPFGTHLIQTVLT